MNKKNIVLRTILVFELLALVAFFLVDPRASYSDIVFFNYVAEFEELFDTKVYDLPITLAELESPIMGECITYPSGKSEIHIDVYYWSEMSVIEKKSLLFHELGHCHLNLDHINTSRDDGCEGSLMHEYSINKECLDKHWDSYILDLRKLSEETK